MDLAWQGIRKLHRHSQRRAILANKFTTALRLADKSLAYRGRQRQAPEGDRTGKITQVVR